MLFGTRQYQPAWAAHSSPVADKPIWDTLTYRRFVYALLLTVALVATFKVLAIAESSLTGRSKVIDRPFAVAMVCVGLAHFIIGFVFMVTSRSMRGVASRINVALAVIIGASLCLLYASVGRHDASSPLPMIFVIAYFVVHEIRDERFFYQQYDEAPVASVRRNDDLLLLAGVVLALLCLYWSYVLPFKPQNRDLVWLLNTRALDGWTSTMRWLGPSAVLALGSVACFAWARKRAEVSLQELVRRDRPLWMVYLTTLLFVIAAAPVGGKLYAIVLLHVAVWWVFVTFCMMKHGKTSGIRKLGLGAWLRRTQAGIQTLHIGLALLVLVAMFVWVYGFDGADHNILSWVAKRENFYYWTIVHVTLSFVPKRR